MAQLQITRENVMQVVNLIKTNPKEAEKTINELSMRAPLHESALLRAYIAENKAKKSSSMEQSFYAHKYAYSVVVATQLAKAVEEKNNVEIRAIMSAINIYKEFEGPITGMFELEIKYLTAGILQKNEWKDQIMEKIKALVKKAKNFKPLIDGNIEDPIFMN